MLLTALPMAMAGSLKRPVLYHWSLQLIAIAKPKVAGFGCGITYCMWEILAVAVIHPERNTEERGTTSAKCLED